MKRIILAHLLVGMTLLLTSCASMRPVAPEVSLLGLQLENLTLSHAILSADLSLYNPNDFPLDIQRTAYSLTLQDIQVARGQATEKLHIAAHETGTLTLRLSSSYLNLLRIGRNNQQQDIPFAIDGKVTLGGFGVLSRTVSFKEEGIIPLSAFSTLNP
ncbi:MAG: LEA type 2 family protein [Desulfuromonadaceae bacterium]|nr:LEA type 2 family protein [Desulfuromonadaceae bacterium]